MPKDPNDGKDVILEVRAGAGGQEAALFAGELLEMYRRFAERHRWKTEVLSAQASEIGGLKEAALEIRGRDAFTKLKHESGVHRVQRVPVTESQGRIHTSTATVAVMPEAEDVEVEIRPEDIDLAGLPVAGSGRPVREHHRLGGADHAQAERHRRHVPGGAVAAAEPREGDAVPARPAARSGRRRRRPRRRPSSRRAQVGTGDRSEKIRTYNFPEGRVTDHRIKLTVHQLQDVLGGEPRRPSSTRCRTPSAPSSSPPRRTDRPCDPPRSSAARPGTWSGTTCRARCPTAEALLASVLGLSRTELYTREAGLTLGRGHARSAARSAGGARARRSST